MSCNHKPIAAKFESGDPKLGFAVENFAYCRACGQILNGEEVGMKRGEQEKQNLESAHIALQKHLDSHGCTECLSHYWTLIRMANIHLEVFGAGPLFESKLEDNLEPKTDSVPAFDLKNLFGGKK